MLETVGADGFEHKIIDLGNKPDDFLDKYRLATGNSRGMVPLLEDGETLVVESDVVAKYVAENFGGAALYPSDAVDQIEDFLDNWHSIVDKYYDVLSATSQKSATDKEKIFTKSFSALEAQFLEGGAGDFLLGDNFSVVECICGPWIQRFFVTLPYYRSLDLEKTVLPSYPSVERWMQAVRRRPSVMESKCDEQEMLAAAERYYVSFVSPGAPGDR